MKNQLSCEKGKKRTVRTEDSTFLLLQPERSLTGSQLERNEVRIAPLIRIFRRRDTYSD